MLNFATEANKTLVERFAHSSKVEGIFTKKWKWNPGYKSITLMTIDDIPVQNYDMTKQDGSRFGPSTEVGDRVVTLSVEEDWAYNGTVDKRNNTTTLLKKAAGSIIARQEKRKLLPMFQKFQLQRLCDERGSTRWGVNTATEGFTFTKELLQARADLFNKGIETVSDTVLYISASGYVDFALDPLVVGNDKISAKPIVNGELGMLSGFHVVEIPDEWMPKTVIDGTEYTAIYMIVKRGVAVAPKLVSTARVLSEDPNIDGHRIQYRCYHDCHVIPELSEGILCAFSVAEPNDKDAFVVTIPAATTTLESTAYTAGDIQKNIELFDDRMLVGTLLENKAAATALGFTNGSHTIAIKIEGDDDAVIKARLRGGSNNWATLDSTGMIEFGIDDLPGSIYDKMIDITCTKGDVTYEKHLSLNGLHLV